MKVQELFEFLQEIVPHEFGEKTLCRWLNEVEGKVQTQVLLLQDEDLTQYVWPDNQETELLAKFPHDDVYWAYLAAMVAYAHGETQEYNNHITLFNERFAAYSCRYADQYRPADGKMTARLYYLTAYSIAKAHGFEGTEAEWLASLHGEDGVDGQSAYEIAVKDGFEGTEEAWLASLHGTDGKDGVNGKNGADGKDGDENVFIAVYGQTALADLQAAFDEGKALFCRLNNQIYTMYGKLDSGAFAFRNVTNEGVARTVQLDPGIGWFTGIMPEKMRPSVLDRRVTALEDSGVGGGSASWELIETITVSDNVGEISRTAEPDGTPYNFSALGAEIKLLNSDDGIALTHRFNGNSDIRQEEVSYLPDGYNTYYVWTNAEGGSFGRLFITNLFDDGSSLNQRTIKAGSFLVSKPITSFFMSDYEQGSAIPAGSIINIYGIRG